MTNDLGLNLANEIIERATQEQGRGADPRHSVFVMASAGSGKTKVLGDRFLRLLLEQKTDPRRILCLTFTKAAAAEMSARITETLADWVAISHDSLRGELAQLIGADTIDAEIVAQARRLFARVLDTPGGLRIHTIHAFCQSLLRRFPLEVRIVPHFELIEEREAAELMEQARAEMLADAHAGKRDDLKAALLEVVERMKEQRFDKLLGEWQKQRSRLAGFRSSGASANSVAAALSVSCGLGQNATKKSLIEDYYKKTSSRHKDLRRAAETLARGTPGDANRSHILAQWLGSDPESRLSLIEDYFLVYFTTEGAVRKKLANKEAEGLLPGIKEILGKEAEALQRLSDNMRSLENIVATRALLTLGMEMVDRYQILKTKRALVDYDDLIRIACDLLNRPGLAPWVLYKLDDGIDHVLIDEAQDTSKDQWQLIADLTAEFFSGKGASDRHRTLFAVGDRKQSIYSFQGAEPEMFAQYREYFQRRAPRYFDSVALEVSFRSSAAILAMVDQVFAGDAKAGLGESVEPIRHICSRGDDFGEVILWPLVQSPETELPKPWALPAIVDEAREPFAMLAEKIAEEIGALIGNALTKQSRSGARAIGPGDIMILVRDRNNFFESMIRTLKKHDIPVAGADRMNLLDQISTMDLLAFADFLLLPEDDLTLAALLKSPLIGLSEEQLFTLCVDRPDHLWQRLAEGILGEEWAQSARAFLENYLERKDTATPYELFADLLGKDRGRNRFYARLGPQCGEAIDEFLNLALDYSAHPGPTLQGFVSWVRNGEMVVKRDLEDSDDRVRLMTVHGAKGLQAPIVFLCDYQRQPKPHEGIFWVGGDGDGAGADKLPLWSPNQESDSPRAAGAREKAKRLRDEEENRLLYVAMTRAEERLYVCGWRGKRKIANKSWHDKVSDAFAALKKSTRIIEEMDFSGWEGLAKRFALGVPYDSHASKEERHSTDLAPDWLFKERALPREDGKTLAPSRLHFVDPPVFSPLGIDYGWRFKRGQIVHSALELLSGLEGEQLDKVCKLYLRRPSHGLSADAADRLYEEIMQVIRHPAFSRLFTKEARAEIPIAAKWRDKEGRYRSMNGRIDRLWVGEQEVWFADFKTNRPAPERLDQVPRDYIDQMAAYRFALKSLYGSKAIRCFLVWTEGPRLMELSPNDLEFIHN